VLYQADERTLTLMEDERHLHPMSDARYIAQHLKHTVKPEQKQRLAQLCAAKTTARVSHPRGRRRAERLEPRAHRSRASPSLTPAAPTTQCALTSGRCAAADGAGSGYLPYAAFQRALVTAGLELHDQVLITVMRAHHAADVKQAELDYNRWLNSF
jgi:hypothetical protein